ncbi:hypothetical protein NXW09_28350 [Bacteroides ovatus]|nr:hypothetical protein [Bacteroides ovatus]
MSVSITDNVPEHRMSRDFTEMVEEHTKISSTRQRNQKTMMFLKQKMDAAQGSLMLSNSVRIR